MARSTIKIGSTGADVVYLQQSLTTLSYNPGPIDGIFGSKTDTAVRSFQKANGLVVDGIVGPATWAAIDAALANQQGTKFKINMFANMQTTGNVYVSGINDCTIGTASQSKRMEAIAITIDNVDLKYKDRKAHV